MIKLSTGADSTLGNYKKLAVIFFGNDSKPVKFLDDKIKASKNGENEERRNPNDLPAKFS